MPEDTKSMRRRFTASIGAADPYTRSVPIVAATTNPVGDMAAITTWDLSRFIKNPVVLWAHNEDKIQLPIGIAREIKFDPNIGLTMRVFFAREASSQLAEQVFQGVIDEVVRAVSVGFDVDGAGKGILAEVSFVPVGLDEDAGTPALNPDAAAEPTDEEMRKRVSEAAAHMARHRARLRKTMAAPSTRTDSSDEEVERIDRTPLRLDKAQDTPVGGKVIPARLSRTGVLVYKNPDGTLRRELRLAEEIFKADSMSTLDHAPVIDIAHHTGMVTAETWKEAALGHVANPTVEGGRFIKAMLHVNDREALDAIERGDRVDISCGYRCRLDHQPGTTEDGQAYDCIQRSIRYNHVALCPENRGRAGSEVGLRLDGKESWAVAHFDNEEDNMPENTTKNTVKIRLDGKDYEEHTKEHFDAFERFKNTEIDTLKTTHAAATTELQKRLDTTLGQCDQFKADLEKVTLDAKAEKVKAEAVIKDTEDEADKKALKKVRILRQIARLFGWDKDKEEEEKMDAMTPKELMVVAISKRDPRFDAKDRSEDYIQSRYDQLVETAESSGRIDEVANLGRREVANLDAADGDLAKSAKAMLEAQADARQKRNGTAVKGG